MLQNNWLALLVTFGVAVLWLRVNDYAAHKGCMSSSLSRKVIHTGTGPIFVLCWLLFDSAYEARFMAAAVPFAITVQFFLVGSGMMKDEAAVKALSRSGDRREILRGPLMYGIVFVLLTILYWRDSYNGMVALMVMCGGDGLADIVGSRFGKTRLPWSPGKSWAGSLAMFLGGWLLSFGVLAAHWLAGSMAAPPEALSAYVLPVGIIALTGTLVESIPLNDWDNITVPAAALLLGTFLL
ncbi:MAG TPA: phosphatidate cytidylyltransferase [Anaerolineaceae bacterium]|nr:phosphatidate cytidylyltransferase [Anaerolineaceae bacterium]HPN51160.1 phosphatidate cytidylyltransferase [Anaerolineaceae bacterium]